MSEQFTPEGEHLAKKPPHSERIDKLLAELPPGWNCPKCGGTMIHYRLKGYRCPRCD